MTLEQWRAAAPPGSGAPSRRPAGLDVLPLSAPQERWWHAIHRDPTHPSNNLFQVHRLRGPLDVDGLAKAYATVVERHESLRTTFADRDGTPVQVVGPVPAGLPRADAAEPDLPALVAAWTGTRFDLATGPLVRAYLGRLGADDHVLCVVVHHLVA